MEQFPSNSQQRKPLGQRAEPKEREKVEQVITSGVTQRKRPMGRRFADTFFGGDARGTILYVAEDILVPAAKDMIADAFTRGFERFIFGESRTGSRRGPSRPGSGAGNFVSYNRMGAGRGRDDSRDISRRARAGHEFDEIILESRAEAELVLEKLSDLIEQYDVATVADLYELVGITSGHTDLKWGWDDMRDAGVDRVRSGGYLLALPKTKSID